MKGKTREEILDEKADEIREEIWENTRDTECKSRKLIENRKIKDKITELLATIHIETDKTIQNEKEIQKIYKANIEAIDICDCVAALEIFQAEEKAINEILEKLN